MRGKFTQEMHFRHPGFTCSLVWPIHENQRRNKIEETGHLRYIYQNAVDKACFHRKMAYRDFKDLPRRILHDKAFNIAKNPKYDGCQGKIILLRWFKNLSRKRVQVILFKMKLYQTNN